MGNICVKVGSKEICLDDNLEVLDGRTENVDVYQHPGKGGFEHFDMSIELFLEGNKWLRINHFEGGWFLDHLESPRKGEGYGKLGLAVFWAVLVQSGSDKFAVRFGGGENSKKFLESIGFDQIPKRYINKADDEYSEGGYSIVIGEMIRPRRDSHSKDIHGVPIGYFPVEFFETNVDKYKISKFDNRSFLQKIFSY